MSNRLLVASRDAASDAVLSARVTPRPSPSTPATVQLKLTAVKKRGSRATPLDMRATRMRAIERARQGFGISHEKLCGAAGLSRSWYTTLVREPSKASDPVLERLTRGLCALKSGQATAGAERERELALIRATYRGFVVCVCGLTGADAAFALAWCPATGARGNALPAEQRRSLKARQVAVYLTNVALGVRQRRLAEALGITPAAVTQLLHTVEDLRDDPVLDAMIDQAARVISGEAA